MSQKTRVLENSFLYTFGALLVKAIGFFLLPVYTHFLTPLDYGIINLVNGFTGVANFIVSFSLYSAAVRFYIDYKEDKEKLKRFYGTIVSFIFISGVILSGLGIIFSDIWSIYFFEDISFYPVVLIALLTLIFLSLHTVHQSILQGMQQGKKLTTINLVFFGLQVIINLILIGIFRLGALGVLLATLFINVGYFLFMIIDLLRNDLITICIDRIMLKEALKYSIPILPHNLSTHIANFASRIFINKGGTLASVGLYSISSQFGSIIDIVQSSVNQAFAPWFYNIMNNNGRESKKDIVNLSNFLLVLYSLLYMVIGLFSQEVTILMTNEKYIMAWTVIPIIVTAYSVKSIYYFYVNVLFYHKKASRKLFIATFSGSFSDIIIAYMLVPKYGMYGAAISFLIAKIIVVSLVVFISNRYDDIGYRVIKMLRIIIPSLLFMCLGLYFSYTKYVITFSWVNLFYKMIILLVYLVFIYLTNRQMINKIIKSKQINKIFKIKKISKSSKGKI